jgi:16S rRNA (uracil1498-N3)-methyltransferase
MNRFFLDPEKIKDQQVAFSPEISHQILHVLRLQSGDEVEVLDNQGQVYLVTLEIDAERKDVKGMISHSVSAASLRQVNVSLCFAMTNREKVEWILQKGTEIGLSAFYPFVSSRTLVQSTSLSANKIERWERIIREAAEQSQRVRLPVLYQPQSLEECLSERKEDHLISLLAWEGRDDDGKSLRETVETVKTGRIALFVGPEGGFSEEEVAIAKASCCQVLSLGEGIMRMETAAIVFPSLVLYELGYLSLLAQ